MRALPYPFIVSVAVLTLAAIPLRAEVVGTPYEYTVQGVVFEGYVARDTTLEESRGTVVIVHDWNGMTNYEMRRADMLAARGYTAFAIDVYGKDEYPQSVDEYRALSDALYQDRDTFRARLMGSLAAAADIPGPMIPQLIIL